MASESQSTYRERIFPGISAFLSTILIIPAALIVFLPISVAIGIVVAILLYLVVLCFLLFSSPLVEVSNGTLHAGPASLPVSVVRTAEAFTGEEATAERGRRLDARAWLMIRGWATGVVKVDLDDPNDPTPYWLVSSRRPNELADAINAARA